jgi:hypothetical protein
MPKNKFFSLDGLLLFILVLLYLKEIRFDNFLSCFLFYVITLLLLLLYFLVDFKYSQTKNQAKNYKILILIFLVVFLVGATTLSHIYGRYNNLPVYKAFSSVHDSVIQTEEALNFLSQGKNPYRENYHGTSLDEWLKGEIETAEGSITNPAFEHYVYLPFYLELSWPFYQLGKSLFNYYDARILNFLSYFLIFFFLWQIPKDLDKKFLLFVLFAFNPLFVGSIFYGYNDIVMFLFLVISLYFLKKEKVLFSSFFFSPNNGC